MADCQPEHAARLKALWRKKAKPWLAGTPAGAGKRCAGSRQAGQTGAGLLGSGRSLEGAGVSPWPGCSVRWAPCAGRTSVLKCHLPIASAEQLSVSCCFHRGRGKYFNILTSASSSRVSKTAHGNESLGF